jgi:hypothetical protein
MSFRISGLDPAPFRELYGLPEDELARRGARRMMADQTPGFPDRVELRDAEPGESVLLLNFTHLAVDSPYRSSHAIFVREGAERSASTVNDVPESLRARLISLRAFDAAGMMTDADVVDGKALVPLIERFLADPAVSYLHAHYARRGCYAARIERA